MNNIAKRISDFYDIFTSYDLGTKQGTRKSATISSTTSIKRFSIFLLCHSDWMNNDLSISMDKEEWREKKNMIKSDENLFE